MKIFLLIDSLTSGGAQRQLVNLGLGLKSAGWNVTYVTYSAGDHFKKILDDNGIPVRQFHQVGSKPRIFLEILRLIRRERPEVICAYLFTPSVIALVAKILFRIPKVFASERLYDPFTVPEWSKPLSRKLYPVADGIVANCQSQTDFLKKNLPKIQHKIYYIPNCVDTDVFRPSDEPGESDPLHLVGVGRITAVKNAKTLIEAARILVKEFNIPVRVSWIGRFHEMQGQENSYYMECVREIQENGLADLWTWRGEVKDMPKVYAQASLLAHPSFGEGFPNAICEALACGCPVIASNVQDHPSIIKNDVNGFLFDPLSPAELAEKVRHYHQLTSTERSQIKQRCRQTAMTEFSVQKMVNSYKNLFETS